MFPANFPDKARQSIRCAAFILFGLTTLIVHLEVGNNVIIDLRGTAIAIATLFGGYGVGLLTAIVEAGYRWSLGGHSTFAGLAGIAGDFLLSALVVKLSGANKGRTKIQLKTIVLAGIAVGISEALSLLLIGSFSQGLIEFQQLGLTLFSGQFIATLLFGGLIKLLDERLHAAAEADQKSRALDEILKQSIGALSSAMVHRDPTTAGHEKRVADLAVAVGKELAFDPDRLEGLYLAALVHDVGQIQIPAEILTRSRRLSPEEFELIRAHCEAGYEILKDVAFPWPIAETVYQHHENVDGSGYPRALKDEQILLEAKIIHVCDSLEAMLSHRPFRRAYNLDYAIEQIQTYSGRHYAHEVVDACIHLFRDKAYSLPPPGK